MAAGTRTAQGRGGGPARCGEIVVVGSAGSARPGSPREALAVQAGPRAHVVWAHAAQPPARSRWAALVSVGSVGQDVPQRYGAMIGLVSVERDGLDDRSRRSDAIVAFLAAGLSPPPSRAVMVSALARARRAVRELRARSAPVDAWLAGEVRLRGIRENAAVLAALELPERRTDVAAVYRDEHPDRVAALETVVALLSPLPTGDLRRAAVPVALPDRFLRFDHQQRDGLHEYVARADDAGMPEPAWPGLWELTYPDEPELSPYHRHAINNSDGEALAVWRALAWTLSAGRTRLVIPAYYRDEAARLLGIDREAVRLVRWEYEVDVRQPTWSEADVGFVPARACVPLRPLPDRWQRDHAGMAGLFEITAFRSLTLLDLAVGADASSELTLFALADPSRADPLVAALNRSDRPRLAEVLQPGDVFIDLAVARDLGMTSYLSVKAVEPVGVDEVAVHFDRAFRRYLDQVSGIRTFESFHRAIDELLSPPRRRRNSR